jgi:hypothetical protein
MESTGGRIGQDAIGRRRQRKLECHTLQQARTLMRAEKERVEHIETKGYAPPSDETFLAAYTLFLTHQRARLTRRAYEPRFPGTGYDVFRPVAEFMGGLVGSARAGAYLLTGKFQDGCRAW